MTASPRRNARSGRSCGYQADGQVADYIGSAWIASLPSTSASLPYWTAATRRCTQCPPTARTASRRPAVHQSMLGHHQQDSQAKHRQLTGSFPTARLLCGGSVRWTGDGRPVRTAAGQPHGPPPSGTGCELASGAGRKVGRRVVAGLVIVQVAVLAAGFRPGRAIPSDANRAVGLRLVAGVRALGGTVAIPPPGRAVAVVR